MPDTYADFCREPSKPHQCMHYSDEDGIRCRAIAMHNEHMCYHHRPDTILPVIENEPFLLDTLDTRADIQRALGQVARQLACNRMDFERARLLMQAITAAMRNLPPHPRPRAASQPAATENEQRSTVNDGSPEREYTTEELDYFDRTVSTTGFKPKDHPRPASVTDQDIVARTNNNRLLVHRLPLQPTLDAAGTLIAIHEFPHHPDAQICSPIPDPCPTTLPTLQAVAGIHSPTDNSTNHLPLTTNHLPLVPCQWKSAQTIVVPRVFHSNSRRVGICRAMRSPPYSRSR